MKPILVFLAVAALGNAIYHLGQKAIPAQANPMAVLMGLYLVAFLVAAAAFPFFQGPLSLRAQVLSWPVVTVAVGVVLIEAGFLLAYRTGGSLQWSGVAVNATSALLLVPVAVVCFRESFSPVRALGIALTLAGMVLMARK
jgi:drug/metabolite transporter (DMT)-like permease